MKILFAGTTANAAEILQYLCDQGRHEIVAVLTREDALVGRKRELRESDVSAVARKQGLKIIKANLLTAQTNESIRALNADLGLVVAYGALLKKDTLLIPRHGWVNIHFSLLPLLRGAAPVQHALIQGHKETGVSVFQLDEGMDTGPILAQTQTIIEPDEDAASLLDRLTKLAITMLDEVLSLIDAGILEPIAQHGQFSMAPKITRDMARINFSDSAEKIENLIRGCNPEPGAWTLFSGDPLKVLSGRAQARKPNMNLVTGEILLIDDTVFVATGENGILQLLEVQPAGKRAMSATDWYRGIKHKAVFG